MEMMWILFTVSAIIVSSGIIFFTVDMILDFRLSDWISTVNWRNSPKAHIRAHREKKRLASAAAEKKKRREEALLIVQYYRDRRLRRYEAKRSWTDEFNSLNREAWSEKKVISHYENLELVAWGGALLKYGVNTTYKEKE